MTQAQAQPETKKTTLPGVKNIVGILGGKGGTGKSFVAVNVAASLAKMGKRVGIFDADVSCPSLFTLLGITSKVVPTKDSKLLPVEKYGMKAMSMAALSTDEEAIAYRGTMLTKILQQMIKETLWGELDVLIVDFPPGMSDITLTLLQQFSMTAVLFVSTPDKPATIATCRTITLVKMQKIPVIGIVENMRGDIFGEGGVAEVARYFSIPFIGSIPLRKQVVAFGNQGMPIIFQMEEMSIIISKIARMVLEHIVI